MLWLRMHDLGMTTIDQTSEEECKIFKNLYVHYIEMDNRKPTRIETLELLL